MCRPSSVKNLHPHLNNTFRPTENAAEFLYAFRLPLTTEPQHHNGHDHGEDRVRVCSEPRGFFWHSAPSSHGDVCKVQSQERKDFP